MATKGRETHLFTLRVWEAAHGQGEREIRFKVQHVLSGEVRYFRSWSLLKEFVTATVTRGADDIPPPAD